MVGAGAHPGSPAAKAGRRRPAKAPEPAAPVVQVAAPVVEPPPDWPANAQAVPAEVAWDGRELSVNASNSSLQQILKDVSTATGVKVDGLGGDQRIFGSYGPAASRDVLSQLLEGAGYNVMMVGDLGEGTPRELDLSPRKAAAPGSGGAQQNNRQEQADDAQDEPEPEPPPVQNPRRPNGIYPPPQFGGPNQNRQELMEQLQQQRQQQMLNNQPLNGQQQQQPQ
jgi:hypothetical protein